MIYPWQQEEWQQFMTLRAANRLPHAMLLYGNEGTGKRAIADALSRSLLCRRAQDDGQACGHCDACRLLDAGTHPDRITISPAAPENSTSKIPMLNIRIDAIRKLCARLESTSQFGGYRVAIIEQADRMVIAAANALLKTLEEPGASTLLILISSRPQRLPVTIRSRCQSVRFAVPPRQDAVQWLESKGIAKATLALNYAHGAPLLAASIAEAQMEQRELLSNALLAACRGESSLSYSQKLAAMPREMLLAWLLDWVSDLIRLKSSDTSTGLINEDFRESLLKLAKRADSRRIFAYYDQVCGYIRKEGIALNMQFVWENLLVSWDRL